MRRATHPLMADLLHFNDFAYVARCPRHALLTVCFGTLALALTPAELRALRTRVAALPPPMAVPDPEARQLLLPTPAARWAVALTAAEAAQLLEVLSVADLLLEAEALLNPGGAGGGSCGGCPYAG